MAAIPPALQSLIDEFSRLPGVGKKSAQRLALHLLKEPREKSQRLAEALLAVKDRLALCKICYNISEDGQCPICSDPKRDPQVLCVVEQASDILTLEKSGAFHGLYHVLGGVLSPLDHQQAQDLHLDDLARRVSTSGMREVILATNPTTEGEATALLVAQILKPTGVRVTRIARGKLIGKKFHSPLNERVKRISEDFCFRSL